MKHFRARVDNNQKAITDALRKIGAYVQTVHQVKNFADLIVIYRNNTYIVEIKDQEQLPKYFYELKDEAQQDYLLSMLTSGEHEAMVEIILSGGTYLIVYSVEDAIRKIK